MKRELKLGASTLKLSIATAAILAPVGLQLPFLPLWFLSVGLTAQEIAILQGVTPVARFIGNLTIPPYADKMQRPAILAALCQMALALALCAMGFVNAFSAILLLMALSAFAQGPAFAIGDAIVLREARRRLLAHEPALDYSPVRGAGSMSVLVLMSASGWILERISTQNIPFAAAAVVMLGIAPILFFSPNEPPECFVATPVLKRPPLQRPVVILLTIGAAALVQSSHADLYSFGSIGFKELGFSPEAIGFLWAVAVGAEVAFFMLGKKFGGARSANHFLAFGAACATIRWSFMAFASDGLSLTGLQCLHAGSFAATHLGSVYAVARLVGEERRAQGQGWLAGAVSLGLAGASFSCGLLWRNLGVRSYLAMAGVAGCGLLLMACVFALDRGSSKA